MTFFSSSRDRFRFREGCGRVYECESFVDESLCNIPLAEIRTFTDYFVMGHAVLMILKRSERPTQLITSWDS